MGDDSLSQNNLNSTKNFLVDSLKDEPIGVTDHFTWYITDIGIAALFKGEFEYETYNTLAVEEATNLALDVTKEEKEYIKVNDQSLFLFYS